MGLAQRAGWGTLALAVMAPPGTRPAAAQALGNPFRVLPADATGLGQVLARRATYHVQVHTRFGAMRPARRISSPTATGYRLPSCAYFYPASAVKPSAAALALPKMCDLNHRAAHEKAPAGSLRPCRLGRARIQ